jgi:hypothetical protein
MQAVEMELEQEGITYHDDWRTRREWEQAGWHLTADGAHTEWQVQDGRTILHERAIVEMYGTLKEQKQTKHGLNLKDQYSSTYNTARKYCMAWCMGKDCIDCKHTDELCKYTHFNDNNTRALIEQHIAAGSTKTGDDLVLDALKVRTLNAWDDAGFDVMGEGRILKKARVFTDGDGNTAFIGSDIYCVYHISDVEKRESGLKAVRKTAGRSPLVNSLLNGTFRKRRMA